MGFTSLEAEVYVLLLGEPSVTGYRIAQALRKPTPNVYKAIESLEAKGAVMIDDAASRLVRPVPPDELLAGIERRFVAEREAAARALRRPGAPAGDDRVYQLRGADQVRDRARAMLARATEVVLVDAFPAPIETLRAELEEVAARGVLIAVRAYAATALEGVQVIEDGDGARVLERWPADWLNVVVDGREHLIALLTRGGGSVHQAIWSGSPYLSWVYHSAVSKEITLAAVLARLAGETTVEALREIVRDLAPLDALDASGYLELRRGLAGGADMLRS
jgi:hypothetical protein